MKIPSIRNCLPESFYPRQVIMDMAFALLLMIGLGFLAYFRPVLLGLVADPANTKFVPRPEWYYLPMFEWLKFWSSRMEVFAVVVIPGILALLFFLIPFLDRKLERKPWRRPIPLLAVAIVLVGMVFLGFKSHLDDLRDQSVAAQLAFQDKQTAKYTEAAFHPRMESANGEPISSAPADPLVAKGKEIFDSKGCSGCHGDSGTGTAAAQSLVGITRKYPAPQLTALLHHPNAAMLAGHMPSFDLPSTDMAGLFSYLGSLGKDSASTPAPASSVTPPAPAARYRASRVKRQAGRRHQEPSQQTRWDELGCGRRGKDLSGTWLRRLPWGGRCRNCTCTADGRSDRKPLRCTTGKTLAEPGCQDAGWRDAAPAGTA